MSAEPPASPEAKLAHPCMAARKIHEKFFSW